MPQLQTVDLSPIPYRERETPLSKAMEGFSNRLRQNQVQQQESDALSQIYEKYQDDENRLEKTIQAVQTNPNLSPTSRVNAMDQLLKVHQTNATLQRNTEKQIKERDTAREKAAKEERDLAANKAKIADLEKRRGLEPGELAAYEDDPKMAEQLTRPAKGTQASQPVDATQLANIEKVMTQPGFDELSPSEQNLALLRGGVSKENAKSVIEPRIEQAKIDAKLGKREEKITEKQATADIDFYNDQMSQVPTIASKMKTLDSAEKLNEQGVTGGALDAIYEKAGLIQFTSPGRREFASLAKDVVKNQNIKGIIGSQISGMEFKFFVDATINPNFSKEANRQILKKEKLAARYEKLYADITENLVEQNGGKIPVGLQAKVNKEFSKQSQKITKELKETATDFQAIGKPPPAGRILMYDTKRRPIHVPKDQVENAKKRGASLT